jgi:cytohesin
MKHILITTIAALVLVGCGESQQSTPSPETKPAKSVNPKANKALLNAAKKGDIEAAKQAITDGADVNGEGEYGMTPMEGTPLHLAVSQDRHEIIKLIIAKGANVNVKDMFFTLTPLDWAVKLEKTETIKLLQKHGGKSAAEDSIHIAAQLGNFEAVKKHLDASADINSTAEGLHETPLDFTEEIKGGNSLKIMGLPKEFADTVEIKAAKKEIADFLRKRGGKHSSIFEAAKGGDLEGIKEFLAAGVDPDEKTGFTFGRTPLCVASTKEVAELLIAKGADVNTVVINSGTPLHYAVQRGYKEIAELLINKGADINFYKRGVSETPLNRANRYKQIKTAELLRKYGGKTRLWFKAEESIHIAAKVGHIEAVKQHIAAGADVNVIGKFRKASPLYMAAYSYNAEATKFLLENGADIHQLDFENETALHTAAYHSYHGEGDVSVVALLVDHGSKINAISDRGLTPLDLAIMAGTPEVSDLLRKHGGISGAVGSIHVAAGAAGRKGNIEAVKQHLAAGTDVDARDKQDKTPLQHAAYWGHKEIAELLIAKGADINAKDNAGTTTLDWAVLGGKKESVELLVVNSVDVNAKNGNGRTPLDLAKPYPEIAALLRKHGGKTGEELKTEGK